jgi:hypothetical protein
MACECPVLQMTSRSLYCRRATIDRELRFPIENDEHFFDGVVEVVANTGSRRDLAAMQKTNSKNLVSKNLVFHPPRTRYG